MTTLKASTSSTNRLMSPFMMAIMIFVVLGILAGIVLGSWFVMRVEDNSLTVPASVDTFVSNVETAELQSQLNAAAAIPVTAQDAEIVAEYAIYWLDDGDSSAPMLKSIWLAKLYTDPNKVELIGIEPDQAALDILLNTPENVEQTVAAYTSDALNGYVVVDNADIANFVDAFAPLEIGQAELDKTNIEDFLSLPPSERETVMVQAAVLQAIAAEWTQGEIPTLTLDLLTIYHTLSATELAELQSVIQLRNMDRFDIYVAPTSN